jgi:acyl dehydratase
MKYFEDFRAGDVIDCGTRLVTTEEIIAFAKQFDPQPFHIDEAAAKQSHFGGVVASGWHSGSLAMRMVVDNVMLDSSCMGSPGMERMRWLKPLRGGEMINVKFRVLDAELSKSRLDRGKLRVAFELYDKAGELLMDTIATVLFGCRPK